MTSRSGRKPATNSRSMRPEPATRKRPSPSPQRAMWTSRSSAGLLANANTGLTLTGAHLTASGNLTLSAHSNVNVNTSGAETGDTTSAGHSTGTSADGIIGISLVTSFNSATIDIGGGSVLAA